MGKTSTVTTVATAPVVVVTPVAKKATMIQWIQKPAANVVTGQKFTIQVFLMCPTDIRPPLSSKTINLYRNGVKVQSGMTDENGNVKFIESLTAAGNFSYYAEFAGDANYEGCRRETYEWQRRVQFRR